MKTYLDLGKLTRLPENSIFVFGSNTQGRHDKGGALTARKYFGAIYGQARGRQGNSYAIVTKDLTKSSHPSIQKSEIIEQIAKLYDYACACPRLSFYVAYGTGKNLNGYSSQEMAEMFISAHSPVNEIPENIIFKLNFYILIKRLLNI